MIKRELFNRTIGILVKSYFNNTLQHHNCYACAVGNLVADNCGYSFKEQKEVDVGYYAGLGNLTYHPPLLFENVLVSHLNEYEQPQGEIAKSHMEATGYSFSELCRIENAFEGVPSRYNEKDYILDGLMAVVDTLMLIHEANETEVKQAKELFVLS